jgi:hypothetical protein
MGDEAHQPARNAGRVAAGQRRFEAQEFLSEHRVVHRPSIRPTLRHSVGSRATMEPLGLTQQL